MAAYAMSFALGAGHSSYQVQYSVDKVKQLRNRGFCHVNKTLLPAKIFYFLFMGSMVTFLPFVPVYMEQLGLNKLQIGIIRAVQPVGTLIACPIWGTLADKFSMHRAVILVGIVFGGVATGATYFSPPALNATINGTTIELTNTPENWDDVYITFSVLITLAILSIAFLAHVPPTVDSVVMELLKDHPETDYGRQRLWGAVGWGGFSAVTGAAMDTYIKYVPDGNRFLPAYLLFALMMAPVIIPIAVMKFPPHSKPRSVSRGLYRLLKNIRVIIFALIASVLGIALSIIGTFQFLFLNELNAPSLLLGLTLTFTCLAEIPFMYIAGKLIHWIGEEAVFALALICYTIRFYLYSILQNPWLILPIELLHGICFGALWPALTSFANKIAPSGMGATVQNLMYAVSMGVGRVVGTIGGGYIYDIRGPRQLFIYCCIMCAATTVFTIVYILLDHLVRRLRPSQLTNYDEI